MFPVLVYSLSLKHVRVRTEATFTAEDPWNQNQPTQFSIESYLMAPKGVTPKPTTRAFNGAYFYGIRSEVDGVERMLPESLGHLWRNGRVPAEALPRLLKEMQPRLKKTDFRLQFLTNVHTIMIYVMLGLLGFMAVMSAAAIVLGDVAFVELAVPVTPIWVMVGLVCLVFWRARARRRKQMEWAIARV